MPPSMTIPWTRTSARPARYRVVGYGLAVLVSLAIWAGGAALVIRLIG